MTWLSIDKKRLSFINYLPLNVWITGFKISRKHLSNNYLRYTYKQVHQPIHSLFAYNLNSLLLTEHGYRDMFIV